MQSTQKPSSWAADVLLPTVQVLAEGSWLAVVYATLQAVGGAHVWIGPIEIALVVWAGMAWGRRRRWTSPVAEALGLPMLAIAAGAFGWLLDPGVRTLLVDGRPLDALAVHGPGWIAALGFWRGEVHRLREDDALIQDQLLRWAVPGLAIPWLIGHAATSGAAEAEFTAAAFVGTVLFVASAFTAMGLARLEAVRAATGSDWRGNRSWLLLVAGVALGVTVLAIPAAAFLGVPARSLLAAMVGPIQTILIILVLLATPVILLAAALAELITPLLPEGFGLGGLTLPSLVTDQRELSSGLPTTLFFVIVGGLILIELVVVAAMIWLRVQERRRMRALHTDPFEERSIVIPDEAEAEPPVAPPALRRRISADDPAGAYLAALAALARDGRWTRQPAETPAAHLVRVRANGMHEPALGRLAAAYQLTRYGTLELSAREVRRGRGRLQAIRRWLRASR
jgi:Domain of unknown function (DUF4129)